MADLQGAVEEMLGIATYVREGQQTLVLDDARRAVMLARQYNESKFRVLLIG